MRYYLLLLTILFSNLAFSQSLHIFKGPTNNEGTMVVLLQDYGSNAYYYPVTCTDYYSDMKENAENGWKDFMREEKPYASCLQKTGNNIYTGKLRERIVWNLKLTYDEYEKTAKVVLSHPDYQSNTFELSEVGLDGYKLAKQNHNTTGSSSGSSDSYVLYEIGDEFFSGNKSYIIESFHNMMLGKDGFETYKNNDNVLKITGKKMIMTFSDGSSSVYNIISGRENMSVLSFGEVVKMPLYKTDNNNLAARAVRVGKKITVFLYVYNISSGNYLPAFAIRLK